MRKKVYLFPILALCSSFALAQAPTTYTINDLGTLGGSASFDGHGFNERGEVAGVSVLPDEINSHAFLWYKGVITDLGTLGGPCSWVGTMGLNDHTEVVGQSVLPGSSNCFPPPGSYQAFLWRKGTMSDLGTLGGTRSFAGGINNRTQVVGGSFLPGDTINHAFLWEDGVMKDHNISFGGLSSTARGINDLGEITGLAETADESIFGFPVTHAFLWAKGRTIDLGTLGGSLSDAFQINNQGAVVGLAETASLDPASGVPFVHAFLWQNGTMSDLGTLPGDTGSLANYVNNKGQVVGTSSVGPFFVAGQSPVTAPSDCCFDFLHAHAFLWQNGVMQDLNSLIPVDSGWQLVSGDAINDRGEIVAAAFKNGIVKFHLVLLVPKNGSIE